MLTQRILSLSALIVVAAAGCATDAPSTAAGNAELGVARFTVTETPRTTTIIGFDAEGREAARVDLIHGDFELTGIFKEDYPGVTHVDGRKLDVTIAGTKEFVWETMGYDPTMHMPADPRRNVAALLEDPHVTAALTKWQVGFESLKRPAGSELAYMDGASTYGDNQLSCDNQTTCGTARGGLTINTCGNSAAASSAFRGENYYTQAEYLVAQCCPANSGGQTTSWFATKACPVNGSSSSSVSSQCGTVAAGAACKACGGPVATYSTWRNWCSTGSEASTYFGWSYFTSSSDSDTCYFQYNGSCADSAGSLPVSDPCHMTCFCDTFSWDWNCTP
jgi:hypothetical protein